MEQQFAKSYHYITQLAKKEKAQKVLEIGAGNGKVVHKLARLFPNIEFYGIDPHIQQHSEKNSHAIKGLFPSKEIRGNFDIIISNNVQSLNVNKEFLNSISQHLKIKGYLIMDLVSPMNREGFLRKKSQHFLIKRKLKKLIGKYIPSFTALAAQPRRRNFWKSIIDAHRSTNENPYFVRTLKYITKKLTVPAEKVMKDCGYRTISKSKEYAHYLHYMKHKKEIELYKMTKIDVRWTDYVFQKMHNRKCPYNISYYNVIPAALEVFNHFKKKWTS